MSIQEPAAERLLFALSDLVREADIGEYRASTGRPAGEGRSFAQAQAIVDEFGLSHEVIRQALDHHGEDLRAAAESLSAASANAS